MASTGTKGKPGDYVQLVKIEQSMKIVEVTALVVDPPVAFDVATPLREVIHRMRDDGAGCALVTRGGELAGVFTERDLVVRVLGNEGALDLPVSDWMTADPDRVSQTDTVRKAVRLMQEGGYRNVPVVDDVGRLIGCVRHKDIIKYLAEHFSVQILNLPPDPNQVALERDGG